MSVLVKNSSFHMIISVFSAPPTSRKEMGLIYQFPPDLLTGLAGSSDKCRPIKDIKILADLGKIIK